MSKKLFIIFFIFNNITFASTSTPNFTNLIFTIILFLIFIFFILKKQKDNALFKKSSNLFFSPLLGFKYNDNRFYIKDLNELFQTINDLNIKISKSFNDFEFYNQEDVDKYKTQKQHINLLNELKNRKNNTNLGILDLFNPISAANKIGNEIKTSVNDISTLYAERKIYKNILSSSKKYYELQTIAKYIKSLKLKYMIVQFMLKETLETILISKDKYDLIENLKKINNPLTNLLLDNKENMLSLIEKINTILYGIYYVGGINAYSFYILKDRLINQNDLLKLTANQLYNDKYEFIKLHKSIKKNIKQFSKELIYIDYLKLYFIENELIALDNNYKFEILNMTSSIYKIYENSHTIKDLEENIINNITILKLKNNYKSMIKEIIKNNFDKIFIENLKNLEINDLNRETINNLLDKLVNDNYFTYDTNSLKRKEFLADYLQILKTIDTFIQKEQNDSIFEKNIDISDNLKKLIIEFIEDKIFNALDKNKLMNENFDYLAIIKSELLTNEQEFLEKKYGEILEKALKVKLL